MSTSGHNNSNINNNTAVSKQTTVVHLASTKLEWTVAKFDRLMKLSRNGQDIVSQRFSTSVVPDVLWELHVYPKGKREEDSNCVSFFLRQVGMKLRKEPIMTEFRIFCSTQNQLFSVCRDVKEFVHQQGRGKFKIPHEKIATCLNSDGSLQMICDIEYVPPNCHLDAGIVDGSVEEDPSKTKSDLCFRNLLDTGLLSDFVIEVGGELFNCHRCILASHSAVFRSMFEHSTTNEAKNGVVKMSDCTATAVRGLLEFMYSGQADKLDDYAEELLMISDKYDVSKLKELCERQLTAKLTARNVCQVLIFADMYSAERLKQACLNYLRENHKTVLETGEWKTLKETNPRLSSDVLEWVVSGGKGSLIITPATASSLQNTSNESEEAQIEKSTTPPPPTRKRTRRR